MAKMVKVIVKRRGMIPGMGRGPFLIPRPITEELYNSLKRLGYPVSIVEDSKSKILEEIKKIEPTVEPKKIEEVKEDIEIPTEIEVNNSEEVVNEEILEENKEVNDAVTVEETEETTSEETEDESVVINDPDLTPDSYYTEDFLTSKNICKKILTAREVQYEENASFVMLKDLVKESNPEVEFEDESTNE